MRNYFAFFLFLCVFAASSARAQDKILDIKEVSAPSGVKAWLVEDHSVPVISLRFSFLGAGAALDPADKQGLSQMASNTMDEGAGDLDSQTFQKTLRDLSIDFSFGATRDNFEGSLKTLTANKTRAFDLLKLAMTAPRFDAEPIERMRAANMSRIREDMTDPEWIAARLQNDRVFGNHPYAQNSGGTLTTLTRITADDLHNFVKTRLGKNILVVAAAGDITQAELTKIIDDIFGSLPDVYFNPPAPASLQNKGKVFLYDKDIPQTILSIMQPGIARTDPDYHAMEVANYILGGAGFGSRLMDEAREKRGLTYGIYTGFYQSDRFDGYTVGASTKNENAAGLLAIIKSEWKRMADAPPAEKELADAKAYLLGSLPLALTSTGDISGTLLGLQEDRLPADYLDKRAASIKAVTAADVQRAAKRVLNADSFVSVLVGKPEGIEGAEIVKDLPNVD